MLRTRRPGAAQGLRFGPGCCPSGMLPSRRDAARRASRAPASSQPGSRHQVAVRSATLAASGPDTLSEAPAAAQLELVDRFAGTRPPPVPLADVLLFQAYGWDSCKHGKWWQRLRALVPDLQELGATHVWLPPPSQSVSPQGYLPGQLYNLSSCYGSLEDLQALNGDLLAAGIRPVADIVINHRCADAQDEKGIWNKFRDDVEHPGRRLDWGRWAITSNDPDYQGKGGTDTGEDYGPAPDLDHANGEVREGLKDWLRWLRDEVGFEGWRFDFVKGFSPQFTREYIADTTGEASFAVGEYFPSLRWSGPHLEYEQDDARRLLVDWAKQAAHCGVFDFVLKGQLQEAVRQCQYDRLRDRDGKAPGVNGWWPTRAVTFVANHDTDSSQQHWPFPLDKLAEGYAYILTHPGQPCVFVEDWERPDLRPKILELAKLRRRNGITADCKLQIKAAEHDLYVALINDRVMIKMGPRYEMPAHLVPPKDAWRKAVAGPNFCVWEKLA